jgi:hypothetical protein
MRITVAAAIILASVAVAAQKTQPPAGYRFPTESDYTGDWKGPSSAGSEPFHDKGDFNGDGIQDDVWVLPTTSGTGFGMFAFLGARSGSPQIIRLAAARRDSPQHYGIGTVKPGRYDTACGKGYWDCKKGEPEKLDLNVDAIEFYVFESSSSIFWWDAKARKFERTWISD